MSILQNRTLLFFLIVSSSEESLEAFNTFGFLLFYMTHRIKRIYVNLQINDKENNNKTR